MLVTGHYSVLVLVLVFVLSMTVGMFVYESFSKRLREPDGGGGIPPASPAKSSR